MKGEIFSVKHFAVHDGTGIRTTLFLKGCSMNCPWCHNPEGKTRGPQLAYYAERCVHCGACAQICPNQAHRMCEGVHIFDRSQCVGCGQCEEVCVKEAISFYGREVTPEQILPELLEDRMFYVKAGGVTLSGGECLCQADFCAELLKSLKQEKINTAVDTCGHVPWSSIEKVLPYTDCFLYDIKAVDPVRHKRLTGCDNRLLLENLRRLNDLKVSIEVRVPYVPSWNDREMPAIAALLHTLPAVKKIKVLGYHTYASAKYESLDMPNTLPDVPMPTEAEVMQVQALMDAPRG